MAEMTVDRIVEREGVEATCRTRSTSIGEPIEPELLPRVEGVSDEAYEAIANRYGSAGVGVLDIAAERGVLCQPVVPGMPDILAEAVWAVRKEQARTIGDVLFRRTRLALLAGRQLAEQSNKSVAVVADLLSDELGWDAARRQQEIDDFMAEAAAEGVAVPAQTAS